MKKILGISVFIFLLAGFLALKTGDTFLGEYNLQNLARVTAFFSILAIGQALVIITGGIDLSVGSVVGYSALLTTFLIGTKDMNPALAAVIVMALMIGVGAIHGQLVTRANLQPFIATLAGMMILRGLAQVLTNGGAAGLGEGHGTFQSLGTGFILGNIPIPLVFMAVIALIAHFILARTVLGRHLYAIGRNEEAARFSGVRVARCKNAAYIACAALAALTGVLYSAYLSSVQTSFGTAFELYAIAAAVLGGCSLRGGEGTVIGVILGTLLMRIIYNGINLLGISTFWEYSVIGGVILLAALLDAFIHSREGKRKLS